MDLEKQPGLEEDQDQEQAPREAGRARMEAIGSWFRNKVDGARSKVGEGVAFLKKLGVGVKEGAITAAEHVLGAPEHARDAGRAAGEFITNDVAETGRHAQEAGQAIAGGVDAGVQFVRSDIAETARHAQEAGQAIAGGVDAGVQFIANDAAETGRHAVEAYRFVKEGVKSDAARTVEDMQAAWARIEDAKDSAVSRGREGIRVVTEGFAAKREAIAGKIQDFLTQQRVAAAEKQRVAAIAKAEARLAKTASLDKKFNDMMRSLQAQREGIAAERESLQRILDGAGTAGKETESGSGLQLAA